MPRVTDHFSYFSTAEDTKNEQWEDWRVDNAQMNNQSSSEGFTTVKNSSLCWGNPSWHQMRAQRFPALSQTLGAGLGTGPFSSVTSLSISLRCGWLSFWNCPLKGQEHPIPLKSRHIRYCPISTNIFIWGKERRSALRKFQNPTILCWGTTKNILCFYFDEMVGFEGFFKNVKQLLIFKQCQYVFFVLLLF